jgi:hypothetical protein
MTDQTARARLAAAPATVPALLVADGRWTAVEVPAPVDVSHLIHHVVRVSGEERTVVAAFSEEVDALVWQDHLSHEAATQEEPDTYTVEGVHVPTEEELAPYVQQARDALRGTDK